MKRPGVYGLWLLLGACAAVDVPEGPIVDRLELQGTKELSASQVKKKLLTTESSWWPYWLPVLGHEEHFNENAWQADLRRIERYYQANGYYQARVVEEVVTPGPEGHVSLKVRLTEGGRATISKLDVGGLDALMADQKAQLLKKLPTQVGQVFLEEEWDATKKAIASALYELGYAEGTVDGEATVDVGQLAADLELEAKTGQRYRFGKVYVAADPNARVPPRLIVEQVEGEVKEGAWFNQSAISEAQTRVFQMGVFSAVKVNRGAPDRASGTVPIVLDVREAPFHTLRFGGGIGADQSRNEARVSAEYSDRNFFGGLRRYTLRAKVGYAFLQNVVQVAQGVEGSKHGPIFRVVNEFEQPGFLARTVNFEASLEALRQLEAGFNSLGGTARVGLRWKPTTNVTVSPSYSFSYYRLSESVSLGAVGGQDLYYGCNLDCFISTFEQTVAWDRRDSLLEPHKGFYLGLSVQEGGTVSAGFFTYLRFLPEARGYLSFTKDDRLTFAGRVRAGALVQLNDVPSAIPTRFFSGGNDMRGFSARRLSPYDVPRVCDSMNVCQKTESLPVGGNSLLEASVEVRWNVWEALTLSLFLDAGYVSKEAFALNLFAKLNYAVGFGFRYRTPIGPIRLDLAFRLPVGAALEESGVAGNVVYAPTVHSGCFGIADSASANANSYAGAPQGVCAFHLSIGEAF